MQAEEHLREGRLEECLQALQQEVRGRPADASLRVFLFQLLSVMGQWDRALNQLNVAADLDAVNNLMAEVCRPCLQCEALREEVFQGRRSPLLLGEPEDWMSMLIEAQRLSASGQVGASQSLREQAFEQAPTTSGTINGERFEWIADADTRLGPMLELILKGHYYWAPFQRIARLVIEAPSDLRDVVWLPAQITWSNGGGAYGMVPVRYPGTYAESDSQLRLARQTDWRDLGDGLLAGVGQRIIATDAQEVPILDVREIVLDTLEEGALAEQESGESGHG